MPLGQSAEGELLLGMPNRLAGRLIDGRYRTPISDALADVLGHRYPLRLIDRSGWTITD
jgi:ferric-dicitrate binding protein FerR (iron transport regulator)